MSTRLRWNTPKLLQAVLILSFYESITSAITKNSKIEGTITFLAENYWSTELSTVRFFFLWAHNLNWYHQNNKNLGQTFRKRSVHRKRGKLDNLQSQQNIAHTKFHSVQVPTRLRTWTLPLLERKVLDLSYSESKRQ